jgi:hypothetical protein
MAVVNLVALANGFIYGNWDGVKSYIAGFGIGKTIGSQAGAATSKKKL